MEIPPIPGSLRLPVVAQKRTNSELSRVSDVGAPEMIEDQTDYFDHSESSSGMECDSDETAEESEEAETRPEESENEVNSSHHFIA
jgi:hypothetical protein